MFSVSLQYLEIVQAEDAAAAAERAEAHQAQAAGRAQNGNGARAPEPTPKPKPQQMLRMGFRSAPLTLCKCPKLDVPRMTPHKVDW